MRTLKYLFLNLNFNFHGLISVVLDLCILEVN